jgi:hypothetical protein
VVSTIIRSDQPALAADDPAAKSWNIDWFIQVNRATEPAWFSVYVNCPSLADAQSAVGVLKSHALLVKSLLVQPAPGDRRVVGIWYPGNLYQGVAVTPHYHDAKKWQAQRAGASGVWLSLPVGKTDTDYDSLAEAEAALAADVAAAATPATPAAPDPVPAQPAPAQPTPAQPTPAQPQPVPAQPVPGARPTKKLRKIAGHLEPDRAKTIYDEFAHSSLIEEEREVVQHWLSGEPTADETEEKVFELFDEFGPQHLAYFETLLACYDGGTLADAMLILDGESPKPGDVCDALSYALYRIMPSQLMNRVDDLEVENAKLKAKLAERDAPKQPDPTEPVLQPAADDPKIVQLKPR